MHTFVKEKVRFSGKDCLTALFACGANVRSARVYAKVRAFLWGRTAK